ncbi:MAG: ERCC4 domain-containing protein [Lachnospiraceae bacterium]|nr:ERCC4 domain-containing protein [Lachnospiraceae bacterium]
MDIQIDSREKARAIQKIIKEFDKQGINYFTSKLLVGDYMNLDSPRLIIDRKQNLGELCQNVCQQHERFKNELIRAIQANIQLVILIEHGIDIASLEDVYFWKNPRKHDVIWKTIDGKRIKTVRNAKATDGKQLYKSLCTIRDRYNVRFEFCTKKDTGKEIIRILGGNDNDSRDD